MSIIKRLSATLVSHIDQVVGEIENHDAVVQAALDDMRKQIAQAKVRLVQVHREREQLQRHIRQHEEGIQRWRERALACPETDEDKALECLRRSRLCQQRMTKLDQALARYDAGAGKLARDIEASEKRLAANRQKLTLMRARQSASAALIATGDQETDAAELLDDSFDRWEVKVCQAEMSSDCDPTLDPLEQEFDTREEREQLRRELASLQAEENRT